MEVGELFVAMSLDIPGLRRQLDQARAETEKGGSRIAAAFDRAKAGSMALLKGVTALVGGFGAASVAGIKLAGDMEQTKIAFTTILGSAEAADDMVRSLWDFAAKTPFEFAGLTDATRKLLAYGFEAKDIIPTMTAIGDAVSALGGGAAEIDRVTLAIGQMQAKGKVSGEEMRQLAELGIPVWEMLAQAIGVGIPEAMKLAEKGAISADQGISAILAGMSDRFKGSMDVQSKTLLGLWSTAKDNVTNVLRVLGEEIIQTFDLKGKLSAAIEWLGKISDMLGEYGLRGTLEKLFPPEMRGKIVLIGGAIAGALVPALWALASAAWAAVAPLLPFMVAGAAIAALAYLIYTNWDELTTWFRETWTSFVEWITAVWNRIKTAAVSLATDVAAPFVAAFSWLREQWQAFTAWLSTIWEGFKAWLAGLVTGVAGWARDTYEGITSPFRAAAAWLTDTWRAFGEWWHSWWDRLAEWVSGAVDRLLAPIKAIIQWVKDALDWLDKLFGGEKGGAPAAYAPAAPPPSGKRSTIVVPGLQHGGIAMRPTVAVIAEDRPEAVVPLDRFWPGSPGPITVLIELDGRTLARAVLPELHSEIVLRTGLA